MWKRNCFEDSAWYKSLQLRRKHAALMAERQIGIRGEIGLDDIAASSTESLPDSPDNARRRRWQYMQDVANWEPMYPDEKVFWYDEYMQRNGPSSTNWLEMPRIRDREMEAIIEARGMAIYNPNNDNDGQGTMLAVSPLDDGSVCLWDVRGTRGKQGYIYARSQPELLFIDGPGAQNTRRSKRIESGVVECVSVDHQSHRAFFAVQSRQ